MSHETSPADLLVCPECAAGKHPNCDGTAWDDISDRTTTCECPMHEISPAGSGNVPADPPAREATSQTPTVDLIALERLVAAAMGSGVAYFAENAHRMDLSAPIAFGNWPSEFLNIRGDLVADLIEASR